MPTNLEYALAYAASGWPVFPLEGKRPHEMLGAKGGFKLASRQRETLERWWQRDPKANVGVPAGPASGFWVVDVDPRNGGADSWAALLDLHTQGDPGIGALVQRTGGGGTHYLFSYDQAVRKGKLAAGIDVKRDGGYIVVEPSVTTSNYAFEDWDVLSGEIAPLQPAPAWLLRLVAAPAESPAAIGGAPAGPWDEDLPKLRSALAVLSADDYHDWILVGAALYHGSSGAAYSEWERWSSSSSKFQPDACAKRWETFGKGPDKRATLASIFWMAKQAGWQWGKPRKTAGTPPPPPHGLGDDIPGEPGAEHGRGSGSDRPTIRVVQGQLPRMVDEAEEALLASNEGIYRRGQILVRVVRRESTSVRNFKRSQPADLGLRMVDKPYLVEAMTRAAHWERWDDRSKEFRPINAPDVAAITYLSRAGNWRVPQLLAAITAPTLRPDGTLLQTPGYDESTRTWYDPCGFEYPEVPENPNKADARIALELLRKAFSTFPFEDALDESVCLALALSGLVRRSLPTCPLGAITAPTMSSGKTLLADLIAILASGVAAPAMQYPETEEEAKKVALAVLSGGDPVVLIDNIERPLQGDWLCTAITSEVFNGRMLGVSEMVKVPTCTLFLATGNQLVIMGDLRTRALLLRLNPRTEKPESRAFENDARVWFTQHRPRLVVAGLTVMRAFAVSGLTDDDLEVTAWGRFEAWSRMVRNALVWLDMPDPYASASLLEQDDPHRNELLQVMTAWEKTFGDKESTVNEAIKQSAFTGQPYEQLLEALRTVAGDRGGTVNARRLGHWLRRFAGRIHNGKQFAKGPDKDHSAQWRVQTVS